MKINFKEIQDDIIEWYDSIWAQKLNQYPWRIGIKSPYEILIAELLLQHTTAKAIIDNKCYQTFLKKFPSIIKINAHSRKDIEEIFRPIGLYNQKTERILKLKKKITRDFKGKIPNNKKDLMSIPGIGKYIANAVLTFAFDKNEVPLDNNLKRIASKVWDINKEANLIEFYEELARIEPKKIYWALFDIGRFHCRKPIPNCEECPLGKYCKN